MNKIELITHPYVKKAKNTYKELIVTLYEHVSQSQREYFIKYVCEKLKTDYQTETNKIIFLKPIKNEQVNKVWLKNYMNIIDLQTINVKSMKKEEEIEDEFKKNEVAIGFELEDFTLDFELYDRDNKYSWCLLDSLNNFSIIGDIPENRIDVLELKEIITKTNEFQNIKIIGFVAIKF